MMMMMLILIITSIHINSKQRQEIRGQSAENQRKAMNAVVVSVATNRGRLVEKG